MPYRFFTYVLRLCYIPASSETTFKHYQLSHTKNLCAINYDASRLDIPAHLATAFSYDLTMLYQFFYTARANYQIYASRLDISFPHIQNNRIYPSHLDLAFLHL